MKIPELKYKTSEKAQYKSVENQAVLIRKCIAIAITLYCNR